MKKYLVIGSILAGLLWGYSIWGASKRVLSWSYDDTADLLTPVGPNISSKTVKPADASGNLSIVNADVDASAAIATSKIDFSTYSALTPVVKYGGTTAVNAVSNNTSKYYQVGPIVFVILDFNHQRNASDSGDLTIELPGAMPTPISRLVFYLSIERSDFNAVTISKLSLHGNFSTSKVITPILIGDFSGRVLNAGDVSTSNGAMQGEFFYMTTE